MVDHKRSSKDNCLHANPALNILKMIMNLKWHQITLAVLTLATANVSAQLNFQKPVKFDDRLVPQSIQVADFDGDGLKDIAFATIGFSKLNLVFKEPNGGYSDIYEFVVGDSITNKSYGITFVAGDFNGDSKGDLVAYNGYTDSANKIYVLISKGRSFETTKIATSATQKGGGLDKGDINGDGKLDFIIGYENATEFHSYFGNGLGSFQLTKGMLFNPAAIPRRLVDFNKDSKLDLICSGGSGFTTYKGDGNGQFTLTAFSDATPFADMEVADFSGDGIPDIVASVTNQPVLEYYVGSSAGSFTKSSIPTQNNFLPFFGLSAFDYNHDGKIDLACAGDGTAVFTNNGNGQFDQVVLKTLGQAERHFH
jgi:hypothetical protein